ncbi:hypothetical protein CEXT_726431 [Caerostris extrusa]|uniref:Secreted protein n=1 Tax=Caerostris extrusa TaxID=172846 RepID=A0AAV4XNS5_CAEEX|nr:hypothetical protein CEXT_726431 [Caerostris extrusa]
MQTKSCPFYPLGIAITYTSICTYVACISGVNITVIRLIYLSDDMLEFRTTAQVCPEPLGRTLSKKVCKLYPLRGVVIAPIHSVHCLP